jgi:hypothetical protein
MRRSSAAYAPRWSHVGAAEIGATTLGPARWTDDTTYMDADHDVWTVVPSADGYEGTRTLVRAGNPIRDAADKIGAFYDASTKAGVAAKIDAYVAARRAQFGSGAGNGAEPSKGYGTLALIGVGIVGGLWWFLHETKAATATSGRARFSHGPAPKTKAEPSTPDEHWKRARQLEKTADNYAGNHQFGAPEERKATLLHVADVYQLAADHYRKANDSKEAEHIERTYVESNRRRAEKIELT